MGYSPWGPKELDMTEHACIPKIFLTTCPIHSFVYATLSPLGKSSFLLPLYTNIKRLSKQLLFYLFFLSISEWMHFFSPDF